MVDYFLLWDKRIGHNGSVEHRVRRIVSGAVSMVYGVLEMAEKSPSQTRLVLAQFLFSHGIDVEGLYNALGADLAECDNEAVSHMAGIIDGITMATSKIRAHGLDNWAKN